MLQSALTWASICPGKRLAAGASPQTPTGGGAHALETRAPITVLWLWLIVYRSEITVSLSVSGARGMAGGRRAAVTCALAFAPPAAPTENHRFLKCPLRFQNAIWLGYQKTVQLHVQHLKCRVFRSTRSVLVTGLMENSSHSLLLLFKLHEIWSVDSRVSTSCQTLRLKCTKFDFGQSSAPDPTGGAYSAPPDLLAGFKGRWERQKKEGRG